MIYLHQSLLFAVYLVGLLIFLEQYANNRLIRPRAEYVGPGMQKYVPIEQALILKY